MLLADHLDRPAVGQRLMDGEVEATVRRLESRPVEWAAPALGLRTATGRTDMRRPVGAVLHE